MQLKLQRERGSDVTIFSPRAIDLEGLGACGTASSSAVYSLCSASSLSKRRSGVNQIAATVA